MNNPNVIKMKVEGAVKSHARTDILARDVETVIDEPNARGGTNLGLTPTETLMASLIGCTNVISHRIAESIGIIIKKMDIDVDATFNKDGVTLSQEVEVPFPEVNLNIRIDTDASEEQLDTLKRRLKMYCPISKVISNSGTKINDNWELIK
jgi:putative redox protein|tara:strand:+ start:2499 stop:2951 length:453 start_codon:yes stop_codon:yes gene_type:complete